MITLAQSDTTVGFFSSDFATLNRVKNRPENQPVIALVDSFASLKRRVRVPNSHKNLVRRSKKSTFIYANGESYRVAKELPFVDDKPLFTTSANLAKERFDEAWAKSVSDVWITTPSGFIESKPSDLIRLGRKTKQQIR